MRFHCSLCIVSLFIVSLLIASCAPAPTLPYTPAPTATLLGTVSPPATRAPTPTTPRNTCIFRTEANVEVGVYRFDWQNAAFTLETRIGSLIIDGPRALTPGPRRLILAHDAEMPDSYGLVVNFDTGGTLIVDPALGAQETRDAGGTALTQSLADPRGDANGLPDYLDLIRVERAFGYYPNSVVRLYLAGVRAAPQIWTFQESAVTLAGETYTRRSYADGKIALTRTDSQGRASDWPGPVTVDGNVVSFPLQTGVDQAVSASTATSGGSGDTVGPYPVDGMQELWERAKMLCP